MALTVPSIKTQKEIAICSNNQVTIRLLFRVYVDVKKNSVTCILSLNRINAHGSCRIPLKCSLTLQNETIFHIDDVSEWSCHKKTAQR